MTDPATPWQMSACFVLRHAGMPFEWLAELGCSAELVAAADELAGRDGPGPAGMRRFDSGFADERAVLRARLHRRARQPDFRGAVFLSNPGMYEGMLRGYLDRDQVPDNARFRRVERQVYRYLQRFCGKNETTSTFGPMGYGEVDDGTGLRIERREQRRTVLLARWALDELARAVARDPALRKHIPLRRSLLVSIGQRDTTIETDRQRAVWTALGDGPMSAAALAARLGAPVAEVGRLIRPLLAAGIVHRGLVFRAEVVDGLAELRGAVLTLPAGSRRAHWVAELDAFATGCRDFAAAEVAGRERLLARLEARFTELTGVAARRGAGDIYADRLILFEEASSPFRLRIGRDLARSIEQQVGAGLDVCAAGGARLQRDYQQQVAGVLRDAGGAMRFVDYAASAKPADEPRSVFGAAGHEVTVDVPAGADTELPAPPELDAPQRYALPDICLWAPFGDRPRVLLARVHHHLLLEGWLTTFADDPQRISAQVRSWLTRSEPGRRLAALATTRRNKGFYRFPGRRVIITPVDYEGGGDVVTGDELTVRLAGGIPRLTDRAGRPVLLYPMLADLTGYPPIAALTDVPVLHLPVRQATPGRPLGRVRAGAAVYQRASWQLELTLLSGLRGADAFLALRRIARREGLPRFVFVRAETERKPLLIDTWSPFGADLLCHLAQQVSWCRAEEMLPAPQDLWLHDERGHYTCELRVQFLRGLDEPEAVA
ncbi:MAG: lantibiotic dehydratase [Pseudonocardiaceae bacterium]